MASVFKVGKHLYTDTYNTTRLTLACVIQVSKLCRIEGRNLKDSQKDAGQVKPSKHATSIKHRDVNTQ